MREVISIKLKFYFLTICDPTVKMRFNESIFSTTSITVMEEKIAAIEKNKTWSLVDLPVENKAVGLKWIYKCKFNFDGTL